MSCYPSSHQVWNDPKRGEQCIKIGTLEKKERKSLRVVGISTPFQFPPKDLISSRLMDPERVEPDSLSKNTKRTARPLFGGVSPRKRVPANAQNSKAPVRTKRKTSEMIHVWGLVLSTPISYAVDATSLWAPSFVFKIIVRHLISKHAAH